MLTEELPPSFSPENISPSASREVVVDLPREPPKDLPMDSDIGLKSPCDGLLAKRRKLFRKGNSNNHSMNSNNSDSCDTPTSSQNSPRDLSTKLVEDSASSASNSAATAQSRVQVKLEFEESSQQQQQQQQQQQKSPQILPPPPPIGRHNLPTSPLAHLTTSRDFKLHKSSGSDLQVPSHYTPSPLAVPSPNWDAVRSFMDGSTLKTPQVKSTLMMWQEIRLTLSCVS